MRMLVIGGTAFVGRAAIEEAAARGHEVTVFHRGTVEPADLPDVEHVHGDRDGGLGALSGRTWDVTLDTCAYVPRQVREVAEAIGDGAGHYGFVSTLSVYPDDLPADGNEDSPVHGPPFPDTEEITNDTYGPLKVMCEREALTAFAGRCLIVRPGYIVGPHDRSDRFTCWVRRAARDGEMLVPSPLDMPLQVVDVRDLGAFTIDHLESRTNDVFGAVGPGEPLTWDRFITAAVAAGGASPEVTWVGDAFLRERVGEELETELPLWDIDFQGLHRYDLSKAAASGLRNRPIAETIADTLAWDRTRDQEVPMRAGLTPAREAELLAAWHAQAGA
jgi:2'-hydroxyisoflavone reductase